MVFSEQAKNKALLDRLTEDLASLSENLSQLAAEFNEEE